MWFRQKKEAHQSEWEPDSSPTCDDGIVWIHLEPRTVSTSPVNPSIVPLGRGKEYGGKRAFLIMSYPTSSGTQEPPRS